MHVSVLLVVAVILTYRVAESTIDVFKSEYGNYSDAARKDKSILTAIVNKYTDKLFENIHDFSIAHGLDPSLLQDYSTEFMGAHVILTNGTFNGVSTLKRERDVKLTYNNNKKVLEVTLPIKFANLSFHYHYDVGALFVKDTGGFTGLMKNYRVTVDLGFDFKTYHLKMEKPIWSYGRPDVQFDGSPLGIIQNIIGHLVTAVLGPIVINPVLTGIVSYVGNKIVSTMNNIIDKVLHPKTDKLLESIISSIDQSDI